MIASPSSGTFRFPPRFVPTGIGTGDRSTPASSLPPSVARAGKEDKDRVTMLPAAVQEADDIEKG